MDETEFTLWDLIGVLRRQMRLTLGVGLAIMGIALMIVLMATPLYRAETLILVDPSQKNLLDQGEFVRLTGTAETARVESEVEILRSPALALAVIEESGLLADPEFGPSLSPLDKILLKLGLHDGGGESGQTLVANTLTKLTDATQVQRRGLTFVLAVGVASEDPARAAQLTNTLADIYIRQQVEAKVQAALTARDVIQTQLTAAQDGVARSEDAVDRFIADNLARLEAESGSAQVAALRNRLDRLSATRLNVTAATQDAIDALRGSDFDRLISVLEDEALTAMERERSALAKQVSQGVPDRENGLNLQQALVELEVGIAQRGQAIVTGLKSQATALDQELSETRATLRASLLDSDLSAVTLSEIFALQQTAANARRQYQTALARLSDFEAQAAVQVADSRVVSRALPPRAPSSPRVKLILVLAGLFALALGVALAFVNEYLIGGVVSDRQLANLLPGARVPATLPLIVDAPQGQPLADLIAHAPLSPYAEAFRRLRTSLDQTVARGAKPSGGVGARVLVVTSSVPGEGKSTSALALARLYAQSGARTLLIDADLRKPSLHSYLQAEPDDSLLDHLSANGAGPFPVTHIWRDPLSPLNLILGGRRSTVPTDQLLASAPFERLITDARNAMDVVIIDTPPLGPVVDARYVLPHADAAVLLVRHGTTSQTELRQTLAEVREAGGPTLPLFAVLSQVPQMAPGYAGYYGYGGGSYYGPPAVPLRDMAA